MREELIGDCRLILGDCRDVLPTLGKFDAVITDPPYGIGHKMGGGTWSYKEEMKAWDGSAEQVWVDDLLALKIPLIIWGGNYFETPPSRCWLVWKKPYFPSMADCELAFTNFDANARVFDYLRSDSVKEHPTQKPVPLMEWCIKQFKHTPQTILDPFMGSGTTGVACANMGRKFTGIEREKKYFDIACERIENAYRQARMFA